MFTDAHCDYLSKLTEKEEGVNPFSTHISPALLNEGNISLIGLAAFCGKTPALYETAAFANKQVKKFFEITTPISGRLHKVNGSSAKAFLSLEGLNYILGESDLYLLPLQEMLACGPFWNQENRLGGCAYHDAPLTGLGKKCARLLNGHGVIIDLAHAGQQSFAALQDEAAKYMVSHANCLTACSHPRNVSHAQVKRMVRDKSFLGLTFYRAFIGGQGGLSDFYRHVEILLDWGAEDILGIGSDFDGCEDLLFPMQNCASLPVVYRYLEEKTGPRMAKKICGENFMAFLGR